MPPRAVFTRKLPRFILRQLRGIDHAARFVVERHVQRHHVGLLKQLILGDALDEQTESRRR